MSKNKNSIAIGIDLGTTHCCVAYVNNKGVVDIIPNKDGDRTTPSYVVLTNGKFVIGKVAKEECFKPPENVVYDSKRLIGRSFHDKYIQNDIKNWTFKVKNCEDKPVIELTNQGCPVFYKPEDISGMLLENIKKIAGDFIGQPITDAVITVPSHFNYHQRIATTEAGKLAGLNVLGIINEPTAAALAYIHKNNITDSKTILIYDLGGGTLDVSIVKIKTNSITVAASAGNTHLGGRDFDNKLIDFINQKIIERFGTDSLKSESIKRRIIARSERIKIKLSTLDSTVFELNRVQNEEDVEIEISRNDFEAINSDLFKQTINIVNHCLKDAKLKHSDIDDVVLVGGSTRIPKIQEILSQLFNGKKISTAINPDEAVAYGAAVQTQKYFTSNKSEVPTVKDITSLSLGVHGYDGLFDVMIPRNTTIPYSNTVSSITMDDRKTIIEWDIYEGERVLAKDNIYLGQCCLEIPPKPPGYSVDLTFSIDENGIVNVTARDKHGLHQSLSIVYKEQSAKHVDDIIRDAEANKHKDRKIKFIIEAWKKLKMHCLKLETLCDYDIKGMSDGDKTNIKDFVRAMREWIVEHYTEDDIQIIQDIEKKVREIEWNVYPVAESYGYDIRNLSLPEICELVAVEDVK